MSTGPVDFEKCASSLLANLPCLILLDEVINDIESIFARMRSADNPKCRKIGSDVENSIFNDLSVPKIFHFWY